MLRIYGGTADRQVFPRQAFDLPYGPELGLLDFDEFVGFAELAVELGYFHSQTIRLAGLKLYPRSFSNLKILIDK